MHTFLLGAILVWCEWKRSMYFKIIYSFVFRNYLIVFNSYSIYSCLVPSIRWYICFKFIVQCRRFWEHANTLTRSLTHSNPPSVVYLLFYQATIYAVRYSIWIRLLVSISFSFLIIGVNINRDFDISQSKGKPKRKCKRYTS